jgi:membrane associated rhomboid family serine protease
MAAKVALILFGLFIGVILGITGMSLIIVSPFFSEAKALGYISNLVVAIGAVFTLGFTLWQHHQQQLDRDRKQALPRVLLMGAPIHSNWPGIPILRRYTIAGIVSRMQPIPNFLEVAQRRPSAPLIRHGHQDGCGV